MTFRGQHEHSLDSKDRVTVPSVYRRAFSEGVVLIPSLDPCIEIYTEEGATHFESRFLDGADLLTGEARDLQRNFYSRSVSVELDGAGRIRIPKALAEHAGIDSRCVVVGVGRRLEIWNPEKWAVIRESFIARASQIASGVSARSAGAITATGPSGS